jgi:hypothetical protein
LEPARIHSRERDFGLHWRDGNALYRAAWIEYTAELYIVQLGSSSDGGGHVELLAVAGLERLEQALSGWVDAVDEPDSLHWLRDRVRRHLRPPRTPASIAISEAARKGGSSPWPGPLEGAPPDGPEENPASPSEGTVAASGRARMSVMTIAPTTTHASDRGCGPRLWLEARRGARAVGAGAEVRQTQWTTRSSLPLDPSRRFDAGTPRA